MPAVACRLVISFAASTWGNADVTPPVCFRSSDHGGLAARAHGQPVERVHRVGVLMSGAESDLQQQERWEAFRSSFEALGWSNGRNVHIDVRFAGSPDRFESIAKEIIVLRPDVIFVQSTGFVMSVAREIRAIPIVFTNVSDPIGAGLVATLARPGGNITGLMLLESSVAGKWLSMLKEISPSLRRVALMGNPKTSAYDYFLRTTRGGGARTQDRRDIECGGGYRQP